MAACADTDYVLAKLTWMREQRIWPNGLRYLWTDAFGVILLVSLYRELHEDKYFAEAEWVVTEVQRVLGRPRGIRIGEEPDRDGQYFHYLAMWIYALAMLGKHDPRYRQKGVDLVQQIHDPFLMPGHGVVWKMKEDLSGPYPGFGLGALDAFDGYVSYRLLDEDALSREIADMRVLVERERTGAGDYPGSRHRHDVVDDTLLPGRALGTDSAATLSRNPRSDVAGRGILLPRTLFAGHQDCVLQLRRLSGFASGRRNASARTTAQ